MDFFEQFELQDCPDCGGPGVLEEENQNTFYAICMDCGAKTVNIDYRKQEDRVSAAQRASDLWNCGKVISSSPGE